MHSYFRERERAQKPVPFIRQLAEILNAYRISMGNPATGVMFHSGDGIPMDLDKLAQRVFRPLVKSIGMGWYGWHGFRRGIPSNLHELGANGERSIRQCWLP
jgi:hypothetical protein